MTRNIFGKAGVRPMRGANRIRNASVIILMLLSTATTLSSCSRWLGTAESAVETKPSSHEFTFRGIVAQASEIDANKLDGWKRSGWDTIAVELIDDQSLDQLHAAIALIGQYDFQLDYYIEVARSPLLAESHPELMASLQGHDEWRRLYPNLREQTEGEVVKVWPWVPIVYREAYSAQLKRVESLLQKLPHPARIWLHDLQGGPSCCGCGHPLCRWTGDYGPIHTAEVLGDESAAAFVRDVEQRYPDSQVVPIWATECEAEDKHELCGGVGCYDGICWKAWNRQLSPVVESVELIGVSCFYKEHQRDIPRYESKAGWIRLAFESFETMTRKHGSTEVPPSRLVAVLQGWNVTDEEVSAQIDVSRESKASGILLVTSRQDQSWQPRILSLESFRAR